MNNIVLCHSGGFLGCTHVENEIIVFVSLERKTFHEIMLLIFLVTQVLCVCIIWQYFQRLALCNTLKMFLFVVWTLAVHSTSCDIKVNMKYYC